MKQACCHPLRGSHRGIGFLLAVVLLAVVLACTGCRKDTGNAAAPDSSTTTAPATHVDRTETGTAPGQLTSEPAQSIPGKALQKALGEKCTENIRQVRAAVEANRTSEGKYPDSLQSIPEVQHIDTCPVGHEPYTYNSETGEVHCPHPGHEKF